MDTRTIRKLVALCFFFLMGVASHAQNSIDEMVENFSTLGSSRFTSVVDRDPKTRKITKVVKVLEVQRHQTGKLRNSFLREKDNGSFSHVKDGREETMTLTVESPGRVRIYMLRTEETNPRFYGPAKVTIIVKNSAR